MPEPRESPSAAATGICVEQPLAASHPASEAKAQPRFHRARVFEWCRLASIIVGAQAVVQTVAMLTGLLIVRKLSIEQYAYYAIATAMLSSMTALADGGIGVGVTAQGGRVWRDRKKLGQVLASGLALRKKFALFSSIAAPVMIYLLRRHGASWLAAFLILAGVIPTFIASLSDSLLEIPSKLNQQMVPLQKNQLFAALSRAAFTVMVVFLLPYTAAAVLATGISRTWANIRLLTIAHAHADFHRKPEKHVEKQILSIVWRVLPASLYYCVMGQITIWIISIFGSTTAVGQLGALTGVAQVMMLFTTLFMTLAVPRFARLPDRRSLLVQRFVAIELCLILMSTAIIGASILFSRQILWILGSHFHGLSTELALAFASACAGLLSSSTNQLLASRGIVVPPLLFIGAALAAQIGLAFVLPLSQVSGVLLYSIFTFLIIYLLRIVYFILVMVRNEEAQPA